MILQAVENTHPVENTSRDPPTCDHVPAVVSVALWDLAPRSPGTMEISGGTSWA